MSDQQSVLLLIVIVLVYNIVIRIKKSRSAKAILAHSSGKGWEILVEEAQAVARRAVEDLQLANTAIRVQRREIAELKFENIRLQAELTKKDIHQQ